MRRVVPQLPRPAWLVLGGECLSAVGSGTTLPFLLIYLHQVRGIEMELAGFALALLAAAGFAGNLLGGWLSDRIGPRRSLIGGLVVVAAGCGAFVVVTEPAHAFAAAGLLGLGAAVVWPTQDSLLATLVSREQRGAVFSVRYATMNLGLGVGSIVGALVADVSAPASFELLFAAQAAAFLGYAAIVSRVPDPAAGAGPEAEPSSGGYRALASDAALRRLLPLVVVLFAAGLAQYHAAFPAFASGPGGLGASALGIAFAANTLTIVAAQLPVFRLLEKVPRSRGLALTGGVWASAWVVALVAGGLGGGPSAVIVFSLAMALFGLGETLMAPTIGPMINDLAPDELRGRYNGACALASTSGFALGPAVAGVLLASGHAGALLVGLAAACALAAVFALQIEPRLPARANLPAALA